MNVYRMTDAEVISAASEVAAAMAADAESKMDAAPELATAKIQTLLMAEEKEFYPHDVCHARKGGNLITDHGCERTAASHVYASVVVRELHRSGEYLKRRWANENRGKRTADDFTAIMEVM